MNYYIGRMNKQWSGIILLLAVVALMQSCLSEKPICEKIKGDWKLESATRNGKVTQSLEGLYLTIVSDDILTSNILGRDKQEFNYLVTEKDLTIDHGLLGAIGIIELSDTSLTLNVQIKDEVLLMSFEK